MTVLLNLSKSANADTGQTGLDNGRAVRNGSVDVEAAREYELPQHQLGSGSDDEDTVKKPQDIRQSREEVGSTGRRLI